MVKCVFCGKESARETAVYLDTNYLHHHDIKPPLVYGHVQVWAHHGCIVDPEHLALDTFCQWSIAVSRDTAEQAKRNAEAIVRIEEALIKLPDGFVDDFKDELLHIRETYAEGS